MPQRTTPFQTLVTLISAQLAVANAIVSPSKLVLDRRTGQLREVDIVIEASVGVHKVTIGIECIEHARRATVEWVDRMAGKHRDSAIDQLYLVSKSGFTSTAETSAESLGISILTFRDVMETDWTHTVHLQQQMSLRSHVFEIVTSHFSYSNDKLLPPLTFDDCRLIILNGTIYNPDGSILSEFSELIERAFFAKESIDKFEQIALHNAEKFFRMDIDVTPGTFVLDLEGEKRFLKSFTSSFRFKNVESVVNVKHVQYGDARVAYGTGTMYGREATVIITEQQGSGARFGLYLPPRGDK